MLAAWFVAAVSLHWSPLEAEWWPTSSLLNRGAVPEGYFMIPLLIGPGESREQQLLQAPLLKPQWTAAGADMAVCAALRQVCFSGLLVSSLMGRKPLLRVCAACR